MGKYKTNKSKQPQNKSEKEIKVMKSSKSIKNLQNTKHRERSRKSKVTIFSDDDDDEHTQSYFRTNRSFRSIKSNNKSEYNRNILNNYQMKRVMMPVNQVTNLEEMDFTNGFTSNHVKKEQISHKNLVLNPSNSEIVEKTVLIDPQTGLKTYTTVRRSVSRKGSRKSNKSHNAQLNDLKYKTEEKVSMFNPKRISEEDSKQDKKIGHTSIISNFMRRSFNSSSNLKDTADPQKTNLKNFSFKQNLGQSGIFIFFNNININNNNRKQSRNVY